MTDAVLTPAQERVAYCSDTKISIRASAGAGKTRVLTARYLWHVVEGDLSPEKILTITFTRKAAAEMKRRIVSQLRDQGREADAQIAETGPIQTIHGFCERLLRENALPAGIDPKFNVLADGAQSRRYFDYAVRRALGELCDTSDFVRALMLELATVGDYGAPEGLLGRTASEVERVLSKIRGSGLKPDDLAEIYTSPQDYRRCATALVRERLGAEWTSSAGDLTPDDAQKLWAEELQAAGVRKPKWLRSASPESESQAAEFAVGLGQLVLSTWTHLTAEMERTQAFDFTELETRAVSVVESNESVRERLKRQYRVVMVDEAQDVNPMQYRLLGAMGIDQETFVGDPQQSIYMFRQANRQLFVKHASSGITYELRTNHRSVDGILSFVDTLFGQLWGADYMPMKLGVTLDDDDPFKGELISYSGVEFWNQDASDPSLTAICIKEIIAQGKHKPGEIAVLTRGAKAANDLAPHLDRLGLEYRIVGGAENFYTRMEVRDLANALQALANPYDDFALLALLRSPIVGLSLDTIVLLGRRKPVAETLCLVPSTTSEPFEPSVDSDLEVIEKLREWFLPLHAYADRLPAWELLSEILSVTPYLDRIAARPNGRQMIANIRKLQDLASKEPELGAVPYAEQIREIQRVRHKEGDAPAVDDGADIITLMTIHKAKGLEFPCVVLPELHEEPRKSRPRALLDPATGIMAVKFGREAPMLYRMLEHDVRESEEEEELRVLYVGMTRAEKTLCLCVGERAKQRTHARTIASRFRFGEMVPPGMVIRGSVGSE